MIELNLLPDIKKEFIRAQRSRNRVISIAILVILVSLGAITLAALAVYGGQTLLIGTLKGEIDKNQKLIEAKPDINKFLAIQSQLASVHELAKTREIDSRLFDYLSQLNPKTPNKITLHTVTLDKTAHTIIIEGSTDKFETINNFIATLQKANLTYKNDNQVQKTAFFTEVKADSPVLASAGTETAISFKITTTYDGAVFDAKNTDTKVEVPQMVLSDSKENTPTFAEPTPVKPQGASNGNN